MRLIHLLILPPIWSGAFLVLNLTVLAGAERGPLNYIEIAAARIWWISGCLIAAYTFRPGDYLRKAWLFLSFSSVSYLLRDITLKLSFLGLAALFEHILDGFFITIGNASSVVGMVLFARAWKIAGLNLPGPKWGQWAVIVGTSLIATIIVGTGGVHVVRRLLAGEFTWFASLASILGDLICLSLIAPLLLTALALRGGRFMRPWGFLTASMIAWLFYDVSYTAPLWGADKSISNITTEFFRSLACTLAFSAGMAQWTLLGGLKKPKQPGVQG